MDYSSLLHSVAIGAERLEYPSAWVGHIPFVRWLVQVAKPSCFVELGVHHGTSYFNICRAIKHEKLNATCFAVDNWIGDDHTGFYSASVFEDVLEHNAKHYQHFSSMLKMSFDQAANRFSDKSIDLLHIDGRHDYQSISHDFHVWLPKLAEGAYVLFHDTNVHSDGFGVWEFWRELISDYPLHLEFRHCSGLGVIKLLAQAERDDAWLEPDSTEQRTVLDFFSCLGRELKEHQEALVALKTQSEGFSAQLAEKDIAFAEAQARSERWQRTASDLSIEKQRADEHRHELQRGNHELVARQARMVAESEQLRQQLSMATAECERSEQRLSAISNLYDAMAASSSWRVTRPIRAVIGVLRREPQYLLQLARKQPRSPLGRARTSSVDQQASLKTTALQAIPARTGDASSNDTEPLDRRPEVILISGEPETPGHQYRVVRLAEAAEAVGASACICHPADGAMMLNRIQNADLVFIWRAAWSDALARIITAARSGRARVIFDVDDLMFKPDVATIGNIDGIRTQGLTEDAVREHYSSIMTALDAADVCTCPTEALADAARRRNKPTQVMRNGFSERAYDLSRTVALRKRTEDQDAVIRIGYAAGTRTHQMDFAIASGAVARILREHDDCRLVLFYAGDTPSVTNATVDIREFPELLAFEHQIEWRRLVAPELLPEELARFDINLAPLQLGNPYCEAKSELKYFEAALVSVPTVASPTQPFASAITNGETGLLAETEDDWYRAMRSLIEDKLLRSRIARAALLDVIWKYGPEHRVEVFRSLLRSLAPWTTSSDKTFETDWYRITGPGRRPITIPEYRVLYLHEAAPVADAAVVMPVYNYAHYVEEALDSVKDQTLTSLELIVVDDCSSDDSVSVVRSWMERHVRRFTRVALVQNLNNSFLGSARNVGFSYAEAQYVMPLDPDNMLLPACLSKCLQVIKREHSAMVYPKIQQFGDGDGVMGILPWSPSRLATGNYIDAMAMVRRSAWAHVGGYENIYGWEDYDLWCKFAECGLWGANAGEVLAKYRVHASSMLRVHTHETEREQRLFREMSARHPWLRLPAIGEDRNEGVDAQDTATHPQAEARVAQAPCQAPSQETTDGMAARAPSAGGTIERIKRLEELLGVLVCPITGEPLKLIDQGRALMTASGSRKWPLKDGRPILFEGMERVLVHDDAHLSNPICQRAADLIDEATGRVLNLSAGGTHRRNDNVVEVEASLFRHTDVVADAHHLPFKEASFELVIAMNAFEHYRSPTDVVQELWRVLVPGGRVFLHTAFLQPLHEEPYHFFNCTEYGLAEWFKDFQKIDLRVSENLTGGYTISWIVSDLERLILQHRGQEAADAFSRTSLADTARYWRDSESREGPVWEYLATLPQNAQARVAAGFEYLGVKPKGG